MAGGPTWWRAARRAGESCHCARPGPAARSWQGEPGTAWDWRLGTKCNRRQAPAGLHLDESAPGASVCELWDPPAATVLSMRCANGMFCGASVRKSHLSSLPGQENSATSRATIRATTAPPAILMTQLQPHPRPCSRTNHRATQQRLAHSGRFAPAARSHRTSNTPPLRLPQHAAAMAQPKVDEGRLMEEVRSAARLPAPLATRLKCPGSARRISRPAAALKLLVRRTARRR